MNRLCYIHSDASCLFKESILLSQTSTVFNVCRYNNYIFQISKCLNNCTCQEPLLHLYVKNCTCKKASNCNVKLMSENESVILELGDLNPLEGRRIDERIRSTCCKQKVVAQLMVGNDVTSTTCIII